MKKVLTLVLFITLPLLSMGQNETSSTKQDVEVTAEATPKTETTTEEQNDALSVEIKAQIMDLNYQKSNDLISIKAYRKSLQIKVKTIKNC
ncbi:MAG: hypothetical protein R2812_03440 [Gelidibacter sp.]